MKVRYISYALILGALLLHYLNRRMQLMTAQTSFWFVAVLFLVGGVVYFISYTIDRKNLQDTEGQSPIANMVWTIGGLVAILGGFLHYVGFQYGYYTLLGGIVVALIGWLWSTAFTSKKEKDDDLLDP